MIAPCPATLPLPEPRREGSSVYRLRMVRTIALMSNELSQVNDELDLIVVGRNSLHNNILEPLVAHQLTASSSSWREYLLGGITRPGLALTLVARAAPPST